MAVRAGFDLPGQLWYLHHGFDLCRMGGQLLQDRAHCGCSSVVTQDQQPFSIPGVEIDTGLLCSWGGGVQPDDEYLTAQRSTGGKPVPRAVPVVAGDINDDAVLYHPAHGVRAHLGPGGIVEPELVPAVSDLGIGERRVWMLPDEQQFDPPVKARLGESHLVAGENESDEIGLDEASRRQPHEVGTVLSHGGSPGFRGE